MADSSPISGVFQAHADFLAWTQQSKGPIYDENMQKLEQSGVKREFVFYGLFGLVALLLVSASWAPFLCNFIGFLFPAYATLKAIQASNNGENEQWLTYWSLFAFVTLFDGAFYEVPLFFLLKAVFLVFLMLPQTGGARFIYNVAIAPAANAVAGFF